MKVVRCHNSRHIVAKITVRDALVAFGAGYNALSIPVERRVARYLRSDHLYAVGGNDGQQPSNCTHAGMRPAGSWATEYARLHKSAGRDRCAATNTPFAAMVVEVFGVWSPEAYSFLHKLAGFVARFKGVETHVAAKHLSSLRSNTSPQANPPRHRAWRRPFSTGTLRLPS